jgi:cytoskeletal protein RodZ
MTDKNNHQASSPGAWLQQQRLHLGLTEEQLSQKTKIPVNYIRALESEQLELLASKAYQRTYLVTLCQAMQVDPAPGLALLKPSHESSAPLSKTPETRIQFETSGRSLMSDRPKSFAWLRIVLALCLAIGILGILRYFLPALDNQKQDVQSFEEAEMDSALQIAQQAMLQPKPPLPDTTQQADSAQAAPKFATRISLKPTGEGSAYFSLIAGQDTITRKTLGPDTTTFTGEYQDTIQIKISYRHFVQVSLNDSAIQAPKGWFKIHKGMILP